MAFKFVAALAFVAAASAGIIQPAVPVAKNLASIVPNPFLKTVAPIAIAQPFLARADEAYDPHPQYHYSYDVQDTLSGDSKSHTEERDGDVVRGEYSLIDADGFRRIVQYTSDPLNGFNAVVKRVPLQHFQAVLKTAPAIVRTPAASIAYTVPAFLSEANATAPATVVKAPVADARPAVLATDPAAAAVVETAAVAVPETPLAKAAPIVVN